MSEEQLAAAREVAMKQVERIRHQLRRRKRTTLDPHSTFMQRWDSVTTLALLFTASVTPFEVCVLAPMSLEQMLEAELLGGCGLPCDDFDDDDVD